MSQTTCPDRGDLLDYVVGRLAEPPEESVSRHVDTCPECQATLADLCEDDDTLVAQLRRPPDDPYLDESQCRRLLSELESMPIGPAEVAEFPLELGEYRLIEKIGRGGMATVYKAVHTKLSRTVALKVLPSSRIGDSRAVARFEREIRAIGTLDHPNIVRAHDAREVDGVRFLAMEYVEGLDLHELVRSLGLLPVAEACEVIRQAALGLQFAHEHGLVHRDVKPSNLMLTGRGQVKILDLGLARFGCDHASRDEMTDGDQPMGTADYMAPEQTADSHTVDIRADIYGLGCTLYKLLCGRAPFSDPKYRSTFEKMTAHVREPVPSIRLLRDDLPEEFVAVLDRMLAKDPAARYATPEKVVEAIAPFTGGSDLAGLLSEAGVRDASPPIAEMPRGAQGSAHDLAPDPARVCRRPEPRPTPSPLGRRWKTWTIAVGLMFLILGTGVAYQIVVRVKDRSGRTAQVQVPDGADVNVHSDGSIDVTLPGQAPQSNRAAGEKCVELRRTIEFPSGPYAYATFSPDGKTLASVCFGWDGKQGTIKLWDPATGELRSILRGHDNTVLGVAYSPDGKILASSGKEDREVRLWDARTGELLHAFTGHRTRVESVTFSPDGKILASSGGHRVEYSRNDDTDIRLWDVETRELSGVLSGHKHNVQSLDFSPDGETLAAASWDKTISLWDTATRTVRTTLTGHTANVHSVAFAPDGKTLATGSADKTIRLWNAQSGGQLAVLKGHTGRVLGVAFSPDGRTLASAGMDATVGLWNVETRERLATLTDHAEQVWSVAFSPDGKTLASASYDRTIKLWDLKR